MNKCDTLLTSPSSFPPTIHSTMVRSVGMSLNYVKSPWQPHIYVTSCCHSSLGCHHWGSSLHRFAVLLVMLDNHLLLVSRYPPYLGADADWGVKGRGLATVQTRASKDCSVVGEWVPEVIFVVHLGLLKVSQILR